LLSASEQENVNAKASEMPAAKRKRLVFIETSIFVVFGVKIIQQNLWRAKARAVWEGGDA
jgi:hypothetical protein